MQWPTSYVYLPYAGFSNTPMQRVIPPEAVRFDRQQTAGMDLDEKIANLHREDVVVVVETATNVDKLHGGFDHTTWCIAIKRQDSGGSETWLVLMCMQ